MNYVLEDSNINSWREQGYMVLKNVLENSLVNSCTEILENRYNRRDEACEDFGSSGEFEFPCGNVLDNVPIHENLIDIVKTLLNCNEILLVQADSWSKKGREGVSGEQQNTDQRMHMDYGNNTFLHCGEWKNPEAVAAIIYFSDIEKTGGGTAIVPRQGDNDPMYETPYVRMPGLRDYKFINDRTKAEEYFKEVDYESYKFRNILYERERMIEVKVGDILFYRLDVWHRGTPVKIGETRNVMNLLWRNKKCDWIGTWNPGWSRKAYYGFLEKLFSEISPKQRAILGVPLPGDKYWTQQTIFFLQARYPKLDTRPYISKL